MAGDVRDPEMILGSRDNPRLSILNNLGLGEIRSGKRGLLVVLVDNGHP